MTVALALLASALFGTGVAFQQRPASQVPDELAARPGLLLRVACQPLWLLGVAAEIAAFVVQVGALRHGSLVVVQPLITTSLIFAIAISASWNEQTVEPRDWLAVVAVVAGLGAFLVIAAPSDSSSGSADAIDWVATGVSMLAVLGTLIWVGVTGPKRRRAAALGLAAGLGDAFMAVLTKALASATDHGYVTMFKTWIPYALCAAGLAAMLITQTAYQTGQPKISIPLITVTEPLVSCGIGVGLFGETLHLGGARGPFVVLSIIVMAAGLVWLSRSGSHETVQHREPLASL
ncbi:MAG TPA: DMT family transporter [Acidimicrobiales bacterium]|nr:DMT family transporter [Acidimicrobiales bacterium]